MTLKPKGISQCECDCIEGTCSDCFVRGYAKPWCQNCRKDFNDGKCKCDKPKPYFRKGWVDNTKRIVKHTETEKKTIIGWIRKREELLSNEDEYYSAWQSKICEKCNVLFQIRGGKFDTCKECTLKTIEEDIWK